MQNCIHSRPEKMLACQHQTGTKGNLVPALQPSRSSRALWLLLLCCAVLCAVPIPPSLAPETSLLLLLLAVQAFLDVYAVLRSELLSDKLLEGQPQAARDWLKEVRPGCDAFTLFCTHHFLGCGVVWCGGIK
jgi:hypothetical protein